MKISLFSNIVNVSRAFLKNSIHTTTIEMSKPKLIVFDLDMTMWPFHVDCMVDPPFRKNRDGKIYDNYNKHIKPFPDVPNILEQLHSEGYKLGAASRTTCTDEAKQLVKLLDWEKYFHYKEIYPGCKVAHFKRFHEDSGIAYRDMLFFDDEYRNIADISKLGVTCVEVREGMTLTLLNVGLQAFLLNSRVDFEPPEPSQDCEMVLEQLTLGTTTTSSENPHGAPFGDQSFHPIETTFQNVSPFGNHTFHPTGAPNEPSFEYHSNGSHNLNHSEITNGASFGCESDYYGGPFGDLSEDMDMSGNGSYECLMGNCSKCDLLSAHHIESKNIVVEDGATLSTIEQGYSTPSQVITKT